MKSKPDIAVINKNGENNTTHHLKVSKSTGILKPPAIIFKIRYSASGAVAKLAKMNGTQLPFLRGIESSFCSRNMGLHNFIRKIAVWKSGELFDDSVRVPPFDVFYCCCCGKQTVGGIAVFPIP